MMRETRFALFLLAALAPAAAVPVSALTQPGEEASVLSAGVEDFEKYLRIWNSLPQETKTEVYHHLVLATTHIEQVFETTCGMLPNTDHAPMGFGVSIPLSDICKDILSKFKVVKSVLAHLSHGDTNRNDA